MARRSARRTTCRPSSGRRRRRSTRAPTSTRSACSRIAACRAAAVPRCDARDARGRAPASSHRRRCRPRCRRGSRTRSCARSRRAPTRGGPPRSRSRDAAQRAAGRPAPEVVPIFDPITRDAWMRGGPQPIADAVAHLASSTTTVEADAALRELVAITCRWLAVLALAELARRLRRRPRSASARATWSARDDAHPWLGCCALARRRRAADAAGPRRGARRLRRARRARRSPRQSVSARPRRRARGPARSQALAVDVAAAAEALRRLEPLLAYQLVVGRAARAESLARHAAARPRAHGRVGRPLDDGDVALLDAAGGRRAAVAARAGDRADAVGGARDVPAVARRARLGAARRGAVGLRGRRRRAAARLATLTTEDGETAHDEVADASPYPGLAAYREGDAERFVGREREVEVLANRLVRAPLIAVLGPSGAGKSSSHPRRRDAAPRANGYRVVSMRPGRHPMHALAALPTVSADSQDEGAAALRLRELGESAQRGLVIVIDQLEELVTLCGDAGERARFAETLAAAADGPRSPVRVVVTLRDDFAAVIESEPALRGRFEVFVLGTPLPRRCGGSSSSRRAARASPSMPPSSTTWCARSPADRPRCRCCRSPRHSCGRRAISRRARSRATRTSRSAGSPGRCRPTPIGLRLARAQGPAGRARAVRAPRRRRRHAHPGAARGAGTAARGAPVLAHLIDARLLVVREDEGRDLVEIVHECLAERWDRLARWRREDAADRALVADLRAAARRWLETNREGRPAVARRGARGATQIGGACARADRRRARVRGRLRRREIGARDACDAARSRRR